MICPVCRQEVPDDSAFCNHCGAHMPPKPQPPAEGPGAQPAPPSPWYRQLLSVLVFLAIVGGFCYLTYVAVSTADPNTMRFIIE